MAAAPQVAVPAGAAQGKRLPRRWGLPCGSDRSSFRADGRRHAGGRLRTGACRAAPTRSTSGPAVTNALGLAMSRRRMAATCRKGGIAAAPVDSPWRDFQIYNYSGLICSVFLSSTVFLCSVR